MKSGLLHNMAPNAQRAFLVTLVFSAIAVAIYMFGVQPASDSLDKETRRKSELENDQNRMNADLRGAETVKKTLDDMRAQIAPYESAFLEPLLESYAMRAKSILDPLAMGAGLSDMGYTDEPFRALPLTKPMARQLYTRAAVRMTAKGSYQEAVSFLLRLEKDLPLVSLQSIEITARQKPSEQSIDMVLEWPAKGKVTRK